MSRGEGRDTLLLHGCCAPCVTHCYRLLEKDYNVTVYFYNSCIHPKEEYDKRLGAMQQLAEKWDIPLIAGPYRPDTWFQRVKGLEAEPEGGRRCTVCYRERLEETARTAAENSFHYFTTTLSISPHKNAADINTIGSRIAEQTGLLFYRADFKKQNGFRESCRLSKQEGLYRQNYCGCTFSRRDEE